MNGGLGADSDPYRKDESLGSSREAIDALRAGLAREVIGQERLIEGLLIALLADAHVLVEGVPGLAKTRLIKTLAYCLDASFQRIQLTPDLLPGDITGADIYHASAGTHEFRFQPGPLFANIVLADEINRAPAKVQTALLEAMEERQVTVGGKSHRLPAPFMVMATQNPLEHEGTFPLPEAQLDRFMLHLRVGYPRPEDELAIVRLVRSEEQSASGDGAASDRPIVAVGQLPLKALRQARIAVGDVHVATPLEQYVIDLVCATRVPTGFGDDLARWIEVGASPRASIALDRCGRAHAWLHGRDYVAPEDIRAVAHDVLRHRLILSYRAQADGIDADAVIDTLLARVALP